MDIGDIYLTCTYFNNFTPRVRKIDFREFWESLVRCALVAFKDKKTVSFILIIIHYEYDYTYSKLLRLTLVDN